MSLKSEKIASVPVQVKAKTSLNNVPDVMVSTESTDDEMLGRSLPSSLFKTSVISIGSQDSAKINNNGEDTLERKRSMTWHGEKSEKLKQITDNKQNSGVSRNSEENSRSTNVDNEQECLRISESTVQSLLEETLLDKLRNVEYDHKDCKRKCTEISKIVHDKLKLISKSDFKFIVSSFIGEIRDKGIEAASQCVWEPKTDTMVTGYFKNDSLLAMTNVFLIFVGEQNI